MSTLVSASVAPIPAVAGPVVVPGATAAAAALVVPAAPTSAAPQPAAAIGGGLSPELVTALLDVLQQVAALRSSTLGAAGVQGGGALAAPAVAATSAPASSILGAGGLVGGGGSAIDVPVMSAPLGSLVGGSAITVPVTGGAPAAPAAAAPAAAAVVTAGGAPAATPQIDMRRVAGTPQAGGVIDLAIRSATTNAAPARSEGAWTVLTDGNGAQLQAHVHGAWASNPDRVAEGIQRGLVHVHPHEDGTLHLHDVA
jgi:hypothetical protein